MVELNLSWKREMLNKFNRLKTDTGGHAFAKEQRGKCTYKDFDNQISKDLKNEKKLRN
jgi:hypothetical protein